MTHAAPIARLALAWVAGVALGTLGAPIWLAPLPMVLALAAPISPFRRPVVAASAAIVTAGMLVSTVDPGSCPDPPVPGTEHRLRGYFLATPRSGAGPFRSVDGCHEVTAVLAGAAAALPVSAGRLLTLEGRWRAGAHRWWFQASRAAETSGYDGAGLHRLLVRRRDALVGRLDRLYGARAPLVAALVFARREGMDPEVRRGFTSTGIAHLLAISGFHVGVVAGMALSLLRIAGVARRRARLWAGILVWGYVGFIGFPDAACRAGAILTFVATSRLRGRPATRWSALAGAALLLLLWDPGKLTSAGFQLSFAGAAGLVAWARRLERRLLVDPISMPRAFRSSVAAAIAATVATGPIVAWHFGRVSLLGVPMTLAASPLVSLALPGALVSVALDPVLPSVALFLAGGVGLLLDSLVVATETASSWPWVSLWMSRGTVLAGLVGTAAASWMASRPGVGAAGRRRLVLTYTAACVVAWPLAVQVQGRGTLEILMLDVGQGDAIGIRTPRGRWVLVDAGPPPEGEPAGHPAVVGLRARGVRRLEALVLTHPDADHFGGGTAVLRSFDVGVVVDPLVPAPKREYARLLHLARRAGVPWSAGREGMAWEMDGVSWTVVHPPAHGPAVDTEANEASIVLVLRWRTFRAVFTGDAYVDVERRVMDSVGDVDLLKVGHHGSRTSTDRDFLEATRPEWALVSVGRGNRYGHPSGEVLARLETVGAEILRTDRHGSVRVTVDGDGRVEVRTERSR